MPDLNGRHGLDASDSSGSREALERAIDAALDEIRAARPASDFVPRLRAHVERVRPSALSRWSLPAAAVAMAVVSSFIVGYERGARDQPAVQPVARVAGPGAASVQQPRAPQTAERPQGQTPGSPGYQAPTTSHQPPATRHQRPVGPEVLVPADERVAVGRLVEALQAGRADAVSMLRSINAVTTGAAVTPDMLTVSPIRIDPVVVAPFLSVPPVLENVKESS